jgi:hypothetical protein
MARTVQLDEGQLRFVQKIKVGQHSFKADESVDVGGRDLGPSPHELLLASRCECTPKGNNGRLTVFALNCHMPKRTLLSLGAVTSETQKKLKWPFLSGVIFPTSSARNYYRLLGSVRFIAS